jgi:protein pelota
MRAGAFRQCQLRLIGVVVQEGLAHLCLVGSSTTLVRAKVEANLPRKRGPAIAGYDKAWDKFMDQVGPA